MQKYSSILSTDVNFLRFLVRNVMNLFLLAEPRKEEMEGHGEERHNDDKELYYDDEQSSSKEDDEEQQQKDSPVVVAGWALAAFISSFGTLWL